MSRAAALGRLGLGVGLVVHALAGAAWMEGAHRALGWRGEVPAGWHSQGGLGAAAAWADPGPLQSAGAGWILRDGARWVPRQPGLGQQPGSVRVVATLPPGGRLGVWAALPPPGQPSPGGVGVVVDRGLAPSTAVVRSVGHGTEALSCGRALAVPSGDAPVELEVLPLPSGTQVRVGDEVRQCPVTPFGAAPAVQGGSRAVAIESIEVDGRRAPAPGRTPLLVRLLLGGAIAAGLFLAEGMLGLAAAASILATLPLALALPLSGVVPAQLGLALGLSGGSATLAWALPLGTSVWLRVCIHAHHRLSLPPGGRDWPAAAPLAMALLGSLGWGARGGSAAELLPVGVALAWASSLALGLPGLLRRMGWAQPLRTTTWVLAPVGASVLVAGVAGAGTLALLGAVTLGLGAGLLLAGLSRRLAPWVIGLAALLCLGGVELAVRGLEAPPDRTSAAAAPILPDEPGPRRPLVIGSLGADHGGPEPGGPDPHGAATPALRPLLHQLAAVVQRPGLPGVVLALRPEDLLVTREDLHHIRIGGSALLARLALLRDLLLGRPPTSVSVDELEGALRSARAQLGDRPLVVVISEGAVDPGAAWDWVARIAALADADPGLRLLHTRGDTAALEAQLDALGR